MYHDHPNLEGPTGEIDTVESFRPRDRFPRIRPNRLTVWTPEPTSTVTLGPQRRCIGRGRPETDTGRSVREIVPCVTEARGCPCFRLRRSGRFLNPGPFRSKPVSISPRAESESPSPVFGGEDTPHCPHTSTLYGYPFIEVSSRRQ